MARGLVCAGCQKFFRVKKSGVCVEEGRPLDNDGDRWGPYKLWQADLHECPGCGAQIVAGFGMEPVSEHYKTEYLAERARFAPLFRVDDCGGARP